jgi:zinc transporter 1/2/3
VPAFNASNVDLNTADPRDVICAIEATANEYNGQLGARISALFIILILSTVTTFFPVMSKRVPRMHIPLYVYLFARYFGAGVIIATAFIHLLDPAYGEIGPNTCVGMTGGWAVYSWCPAIVLTSVMVVFLFDFGAERYVEIKYGVQSEADLQETITGEGDRRASEGGIVEGRMEHQDRNASVSSARPPASVVPEMLSSSYNAKYYPTNFFYGLVMPSTVRNSSKSSRTQKKMLQLGNVPSDSRSPHF